jgi:hypothetical protein
VYDIADEDDQPLYWSTPVSDWNAYYHFFQSRAESATSRRCVYLRHAYTGDT